MHSQNLRIGVFAGVVSGAVLGSLMGSMHGLLLFIGKMAGLQGETLLLAALYPVTGFLLHMAASAFAGAFFGTLVGSGARSFSGSLARGLAFGAALWLAGPMTAIPYLVGAGATANWSYPAALALAPSLALHLAFGCVLGASFGWWKLKSASSGETAVSLA